MAKKITDLPTANTFTGVESVLLTQNDQTVQGSVSAILEHGLTYVAAASGDWNSSYTTVESNSASWDAHADISLLQTTSGDWDSSYTTVESNSASWDAHTDPYDDTLLQSSSSNWDSSYNTVESNSASWDAHTDPYDDTLLQSSSSNWDSSYTTVEANSASWASHTDVNVLQSASTEWDDTSTVVQTNSSSWAAGGDVSVTPQVVLANGVQILNWDHALGSTIKHTLTDDVYSVNISNVVNGDSGLIILRQDGLGPWTFSGHAFIDGGAFGSQRILAGDLASVAKVLPGEVITLGWFYDEPDGQIYYYVSDID